jgi:hypothetical protein
VPGNQFCTNPIHIYDDSLILFDSKIMPNQRNGQQTHPPPNKKKRKRSNDADLTYEDVLNEDRRKQMKFTTTIVLAMMVLTLTILGGCAEMTEMLLNVANRRSTNRSDAAKDRTPKLRTTWKKEMKRFSDRMFYRLFRMPKPCFSRLCNKIESVVGRKEFKSEKYIKELKEQGHTTKEGSMYLAHVKKNGDYIPGEVKVAITLRILAGATYLDMFLWFNVNANYVNEFTKKVMKDWFCNDKVMCINYYDLLNGKDEIDSELDKISFEFGSKTNFIMKGCIGAIDGWMVKIRCPSWTEVVNPGKYYSRKGFYALNVQVIVDKKKRILWRTIGEKGSAHDSKVFNESNLGKFLLETADDFYGRGLYLIGDSAYALRSYLLTPYDNAQPGSKEDCFNFYLSSNRIYVECSFGEIDRRWGIFWKPLQGQLKNHKYTIDSALRLHNFIVDYREEIGGTSTTKEKRFEREELNVASDDFLMENPYDMLGPLSESDEMRKTGRPTTAEARERVRGKAVRDSICDALHWGGYARPSQQRQSSTTVVDRHNRVVERA